MIETLTSVRGPKAHCLTGDPTMATGSKRGRLRAGRGFRWRVALAFLLAGPWLNPLAAGEEYPADLDLTSLVHPKWEDFKAVFVEQACPFAGSEDFDFDQVSCGYVLVPEDRMSDPSRLIRLAVMRFPALSDASTGAGPGPSVGAILRLDGGPGGPSLFSDRANFYSDPQNRSLRTLGDVVFHDQRGVGFSDSAICRAVPDAYQYGVRLGEGGYQLFEQRMLACLDEAQRQGIKIEAYSTWHNAMDVRDLRRALGYQSWNLFGVSYGAQLAQAVLEVDPDGVRSAIFDSVAPAAPGPLGGWGAVGYGFRSSLEVLDQACQVNPGCSSRFPSLAQALVETIRSFDHEPMVLQGLDPTRFHQGMMVLDSEAVALFSFQVLYNGSVYSDLPVYVDVLRARDEPALRSYLNEAAWPIDHSVGQGMRLIANCAGSSMLEPQHQTTYELEEPEFSRWLRYHNVSDLCRSSGVPLLDPAARELKTSVPVLIGAGAADPVTPPFRAREVLSGLGNVTYVELPFAGHGVLLDGACAEQITTDFLLDPEASPDLSCAQQAQPPDFLTGYKLDGRAFAWVQQAKAGERLRSLLAVVALGAFAWGVLVLSLGRALVDRTLRFRAHSTEALCLLSTSATLAALAVSAAMVQAWADAHPLAAVAAVPQHFIVGGLLALFGLVTALLAAWLRVSVRHQRPMSPSGWLGFLLVVLVSGYTLTFLQSIGFGI